MTSPEPGSRDECPHNEDRASCAVGCGDVWPAYFESAPTPAAAAAAQPTGDGRCQDCGRSAFGSEFEASGLCQRCLNGPAPLVTPDSDQLRDEIAQTVFAMDRRGLHVNKLWSEIDGRQRGPYLRTADALLSGPVGRLLAERDRHAAQVQAVRDALDPDPADHLTSAEVLADVRRALAAPAAEDGEP